MLAEDRLHKGTYVAVKVIDRKALHGKEESLHNEISVLQKWVNIKSPCNIKRGCQLTLTFLSFVNSMNGK